MLNNILLYIILLKN